ncbi:MAG: hypothetical protein HKN25_14910 [Pyrinomonadaceae bacterium]|nr:hypothetical protein [Pyrinomonadaceae bacterium]
MTKNVKSRIINLPFFLGFGAGEWIFVVLNILAYRRSKYPSNPNSFCDPCRSEFGFPFALYQQDNSPESGEIIWGGLVFDVLIATVCAVVIGLVFSAVWSSLSSDNSR